MRYALPKKRLPNVALTLVVINVIAFLLQAVFPWFTEMFILVSSEVLAKPWTLVTTMFLHGGIAHLLFNMYALYIFGTLIEARIGTKRFLYIYFASGIVASIASTFFYSSVLGASGAIMAVLGVTIVLMPHLRVLFFFAIPMSLRTAGIIFALIDIFGVVHPGGRIANIAHLAGLACGLAFGWYLHKKKKEFSKNFTKKKSSGQAMNTADIQEYLRNGKL